MMNKPDVTLRGAATSRLLAGVAVAVVLQFTFGAPAWAVDSDGDGLDDSVETSRLRSEPLGAARWIAGRTPGVFGVGVQIADVDGDGRPDWIVNAGGAAPSGSIGWYRNQPAEHHFGPAVVVNLDPASAATVYTVVANVPRDGRIDVIASGATGIDLYPNRDALGHFAAAIPIADAASGLRLLPGAVGDLNGDGRADLVVQGGAGTTLGYLPASIGPSPYGAFQLIHASAENVVVAQVVDLDADGDRDLLTLARDSDVVGWYENLDGQGSFGARQTILADPHVSEVIIDVRAADIDGDGDADVVSSGGFFPTLLRWQENAGNGSFGAVQGIARSGSGPSSSSTLRIHAIDDVDGDDDPDLVATHPGSFVSWYENLDGQGSFGSAQTIGAPLQDPVVRATVADLDLDGDSDVVAWGSQTIVGWYENLDGQGGFGAYRVQGGEFPSVAPAVVDVDSDGDLDVVGFAEIDASNFLGWWENVDGRGFHFALRQINRGTAFGRVHGVDLDGDNDVDIASAGRWYRNLDGNGSFGPQLNLFSGGPTIMDFGDIDGNGTADIAYFQSGTFAWRANGGNGSFGGANVVLSGVATTTSVAVMLADLDGDDDLDIIGNSDGTSVFEDDRLFWFENLDGLGTFGASNLVSTTHWRVGETVFRAADLDGDDDVDLLACETRQTNKAVLAWFENLDGLGSFGSPIDVGAIGDFVGCGLMDVGDLDGDDDLDLAAAGTVMKWYENVDGAGSFVASASLAAMVARSFDVADMDGDGDLDFVTQPPLVQGDPFSYQDSVGWYANPGTDPASADTDGDGLTDGEEVLSFGIDPGSADSDEDGASDAVEIATGTDPLDPTSAPSSILAVPGLTPIAGALLAGLLAAVAVMGRRWVTSS